MHSIADEAQQIIDEYGLRMERNGRRISTRWLIAVMMVVAGAAILSAIALVN